MIVVTLHAVVSLRQFQMRALEDTEEKVETKVLFPATDRAKAETNLKSMIQYLFNYGFYKFGQEISLIMLVTTIAYRQDIVAIFYVVWLAVLLMFSRARRSSVWGIFQVFIALSIFVQYLVLLGLPPSLCIGRWKWNISYIIFKQSYSTIINCRLPLGKFALLHTHTGLAATTRCPALRPYKKVDLRFYTTANSDASKAYIPHRTALRRPICRWFES